MRARNRPLRPVSAALAMACLTVIPSSRAGAAGVIDEYQFTNLTFNPTTLAANVTASPFTYVNTVPSQPPAGNPPFIVPGGTLADDPAYFVGQGDWFPRGFAGDNYYTFNVTVPPGMAIDVNSFSFSANSRQMVPFLTQVQYSTSPTFSNPVNFDTDPIDIPTQQVWNSFSAADAPIASGVGTYYFRIESEIDPNGGGTISDLLNLGNIALNGAVHAYAGVTPMYWDPANSGSPGSGGAGNWLAAASWADGAIDYPWSNTMAESANFGGAGGGTVALNGNVSALNGINFTTAGYNITGGSGQTLTLSGTITTGADATFSAVVSNSGVGSLIKDGPAALVIAAAGNLNCGPGLAIIGGAINQTGGTVLAGPVAIAAGVGATGTYSLSGGILTTPDVSGGSGTSTFSFDGGTLSVSASNFALFNGVTNVVVQNGGATIDTGANTVALAQSITPAAGSSGGLVKLGSGTLIFGDTGNINVAYNAGAVIDVQAGLLTGSSNFQGIWTANLASLNVAGGATFDAVEAGPANTIQIDALTGAGTVRGGYFGVSTLVIGAAGGGGTFTGTLQDDPGAQLAITKVGGGTETFKSTNTYSGMTTVSGGTLEVVESAIPSTLVGISSGSILEYNDAGRVFQSQVTYTGGGTLRKTGLGNLVFGGLGVVNVNLSAGSLIDVEEGELTGSSSFDGNLTNNFASLNIAAGASFDAVEAGLTSTLQIDALTGAGTFSGGYSGANNGLATVIVGDANGSGVFSGVLEDDGGAHLGVTKTGAGTQTFSGTNTYTGGTKITGGTLVIGAASALANGAVTVNANTVLQLAAGIGRASVASLSIVGDGRVDIANNRLTINYGSSGADPITAIKTALRSGYNNGTWTGVGIGSSTAAGNPNKFAVGYLDGNNPADTTAHTVSANQLIVKYTLEGDAFLENTVGFDDLVVVAQNFGFAGKDWAGGNFNYDPTGSVGFADLVFVAQNFGFSSGVSSGLTAGGLSPAWDVAQVPEPGALSLLIFAGGGWMGRRRRR